MFVRNNERDEPYFLGMGSTFTLTGGNRDNGVELILPEEAIRERNAATHTTPKWGFDNPNAIKTRQEQ